MWATGAYIGKVDWNGLQELSNKYNVLIVTNKKNTAEKIVYVAPRGTAFQMRW